jgi:hypothetical protein
MALPLIVIFFPQVAASCLLRAGENQPWKALNLIRRPILMIGSKGDTLCPFAPIAHTSTLIPTAELVEVTGGT